MPVFEIIVLEHPKKKAAKEGELEKIIFGPAPIVAADAQQAVIDVMMDNADKLKKIDRTRREVIIRPFAQGSVE